MNVFCSIRTAPFLSNAYLYFWSSLICLLAAVQPVFTPLRAPRDTFDWAAQLDGSAVVQSDAKLQEFVPQLRQRYTALRETLSAIQHKFGGLEAFAHGHKVFGFHRLEYPQCARASMHA